jgi:hypothetical protein
LVYPGYAWALILPVEIALPTGGSWGAVGCVVGHVPYRRSTVDDPRPFRDCGLHEGPGQSPVGVPVGNVTSGFRGMYLPFARPRRPACADVPDLVWRRRLARVASMRDPIRVDPGPTAAALGERPHGDNLRPILVPSAVPGDLERQGDETVGSTLRASLRGAHMVPLPSAASTRTSARERDGDAPSAGVWHQGVAITEGIWVSDEAPIVGHADRPRSQVRRRSRYETRRTWQLSWGSPAAQTVR